MKKMGLLLGAPLVLGFALLVAPTAQATTSGCMYPALAGEIAFWMTEDYAAYLSGDWDQNTCEDLAVDFYNACKDVGRKQVECLQKLRRRGKEAGIEACSVYEGAEQEECLAEVAEGFEFFSEIISFVNAEMREECKLSRDEYKDDYCIDDVVDD